MEENTFDIWEFETYLTDEFFNGNEPHEIVKLINERLKSDEDFSNRYELWLEEVGYDSWKEFYEELEGQESIAWENMFQDGDEDDAITDYLTKE